MKPLLFLISLCICSVSNAANYYFSSTTGDDSRSSVQAQNPATPWKTVGKLNSFFSTIAAGDSVLFKRGETFYGTIVINKSGTSANYIKIGAYGTGAKPVITGLTDVTSWTSLGGNIWESTTAVSTLATLKMVVVNGVSKPMGRYPNVSATGTTPGHPVSGNNGWLNFESNGSWYVTDNQLTGTPNWTGAQIVLKTVNWVIDVGNITNHSGNTITYVPSAIDGGTFSDAYAGNPYFIQNDPRTLDEAGEWYYNPSTKKLRIYSTSTPSNVQVATVQNLVQGNNKNYISFSNIDLLGSNADLMFLSTNTTGWNINGCTIAFSGRDGIYTDNANSCNITNSTIKDINNNGIMFRDAANNNNFISNTVLRVGIFAGMMDQSIYFSGEGIHCIGSNVTFTGNSVTSVGLNGIRFGGTNVLVNRNFVSDFCVTKSDGGGIYTWGIDGNNNYSNQVIEDNIVMDCSKLGDIGNWLELEETPVKGIYLDASSKNVTIRRNSIANVTGSGIYMNSPINCIVDNNTVYNTRYAAIHVNKQDGSPNLNFRSRKNILVAKSLITYPTNTSQRCFYYLSRADDMTTQISALDSNIYARPIDDAVANPISRVVYSTYSGPGEPGPQYKYTLAAWKSSFTMFDQNSKKSPRAVTSEYDLRFVYNESAVNKTISLGAAYVDMNNVSYPGTITLAPNTSAVLIKTDATNILPVADAGPDQQVSSATPSITLDGKGIDHDGFISAYSWTKLSGPTGNIITLPNAALTIVTGLVNGTYVFELRVTDNRGGIGRDTITVNFGPIIVPVKLDEFTATARSNKSTLLQWKTSTEINSDYFQVERSTDGRNFIQIGQVRANGNSSSIISYQLTDNFPESGINYYRLKIVDLDKQFEYSRTVSVNFKETGAASIEIKSVKVSNHILYMDINSSKQQQAVLNVYDAAGRTVMATNIQLQKGINNFNKEMMLSSAVYYCKIFCGNEKLALSVFNGQ